MQANKAWSQWLVASGNEASTYSLTNCMTYVPATEKKYIVNLFELETSQLASSF
jgi:hypothetical protein